MLPWKLRKRQFLPVHQNFSSVHFSLAKFQLVSSNLSVAMIWQMTHNHKLPKLCSATLKCNGALQRCRLKGRLAAARGLGLLLYGSNMAGGRYAYPYGPSPTDESLKLRVLDDEKHSIVFD